MATYVIGDVQGCLEPLLRLLTAISFEAPRDQLLFAGDLVNRGPDSLGVLRLVRSLGQHAHCVLGNHDLHLLKRAHGLAPAKPRDTLDDILGTPDRAALFDWIASWPLILPYRNNDKEYLVVHAGLLPEWTVADAMRHAERLAQRLQRTPTRLALLGERPADSALSALTTLRLCDANGRPIDYSGNLAEAPAGSTPWFAHPWRKSRGAMVLFGHWAALGRVFGDDYVGLDSGCVWGRELSALCLEDWRLTTVPATVGKSKAPH